MVPVDPFEFATRWMDYASGRLSEEEVQALLHEIQSNPLLAGLHQELSDPEQRRANLEELSGYNIQKALKHSSPSKVHRFPTAWIWAAASIVLLFAGMFAYFAKPTSELQVFTQLDSSEWSTTPRILLADGRSILLDTLKQLETASDMNLQNAEGVLTIAATAKVVDDPVEWHRLQIPFGRQYKMQLPDGSRVTLHAGTTLEFPSRFEGVQRVVRLNGEAFFEVEPNKNLEFVVKLSNVDVTVFGTTFNVKAFEQDEFIQTTLLSGSVALRDSAQRLHYLKPNEQALWERRNGSVQIRSVDASVYTAWVGGYFSFNQTSLEQVMQQVGHWYGKDVLYLNARHKKTRYTGSVRMYDSIQDVLRKFELAGNLAFDMDDQCIRVQRK